MGPDRRELEQAGGTPGNWLQTAGSYPTAALNADELPKLACGDNGLVALQLVFVRFRVYKSSYVCYV